MLKAGFARLDITPPLGVRVAGYFYERRAEEILDPLEVNAIAVGNGNDTVIIAAVDMLGISMARCNVFRKMMSERTGVPVDHIFVSCLHQHTSIYHVSMEPDPFNQEIEDSEFVGVLAKKLCDAAQLAIADMSDAAVSVCSEDTAEEIAFIRRYVLDDGSIVTNPRADDIPHIVKRADESDNTVRLVRFKREGTKDIALVNFSTHPDVVGGKRFSADWCGFVRRYVEADLSDVHCIYLNGAQGDSNHIDFIKGKRTGYDHANHMGRVIADTVVSVWDRGRECVGDSIYGGVDIVYNKTRTDGEEKYPECKKFFDDYKAGKLVPAPHITEIAGARRIVEMRDAPIYQKVPVSVIGFAGIAFVGFGGEPFTHYATAARAAAPDKFVIAACCTNGYEGYLPTKKAFAEGGYEASSSSFTPSLEDECIAAASEMLKQF